MVSNSSSNRPSSDDSRVPAGLLERLVGHLRFPQLFLLVSVLFVVNLVIPDPIPLVDEIALGLLAMLLGNLKQRVTPGGRASTTPDPDDDEREPPRTMRVDRDVPADD